MAKIKPGKFEQLEGKFREVFQYSNTLSRFTNEQGEVSGDLGELVRFFASEMKKEGAKEDDIKRVVPKLQEQYMQGERRVFLEPGQKHFKEADESYKSFVKDNIEGIIDSTDADVLKSGVLPVVVGKYKSDVKQYKDLDKLVAEVGKLNGKVKALQDPEKQEEVLKELVEKRAKHYKKRYEKNQFLIDMFSKLIDPKSELQSFQEEVKNKNKELDDALKNDVKGYLKSLKISGDDLAKIYAGIFSKAYEEASERQKK